MVECHKSISKYNISLLIFENDHLNENINYREELRSLRIHSYMFMKTNLEKLMPQIDE